MAKLNALHFNIDKFTEFPKAISAHKDELMDKTLVSFCTGGIRCEKAAILMREEGLEHVYQLEGGILKYFEETDGSHYWLSARVLRFAGSYMATSRLPRALQPTLNRLALQTQASFSAVVLDGDECVIVARSAGVAEPVRHLAYGLHLGAIGRAHV